MMGPHVAAKETDARTEKDPPTVRCELEATSAGLSNQGDPCPPHTVIVLGSSGKVPGPT